VFRNPKYVSFEMGFGIIGYECISALVIGCMSVEQVAGRIELLLFLFSDIINLN